MRLKQALLIVALSSASAVGSVALYQHFKNDSDGLTVSAEKGLPANYAGFFDGKGVNAAEAIDFTAAAAAAVPAVVHIKTKVPARRVTNELPRSRYDIFEEFFGDGYSPSIIPEQRASGSGVIISEDGYIVTNNHVISDQSGGVAAEINVTLANRKNYKARVIGRDPSSDLAVLKIDGEKLPYLVYGTSETVQLGQWVLAIGYPLTLDATVTAGIVSATGRSIGINNRQIRTQESPIESFIQTDAAVNQGNSGGALVNTRGELIGVNSAILAPSGTYAGYSFAIPVNIIKKIVNDIIEFGEVQRGFLGVSYPTEELSDEQLRALGVPANVEGIYVNGITPGGGAEAAGLRKGDVVTKVNGDKVRTGIQMSAKLANFRPGDKVQISYIRGGKEATTSVTLKKRADTVKVSLSDRLRADMVNVGSDVADRNGIDGGVVIRRIYDQSPFGAAKIQAGFIITGVDNREIKNMQELEQILNTRSGTVQITGIYPGSPLYQYPVNLGR